MNKSVTSIKHHIRVGLIALMTTFSSFVKAQDIHFSNWGMSPLNLNPANAGLFDGDGRLIFNYRNQWKSVPVPYNTFSFGADFRLKKSLLKGTHEALGLIMNHDASGDGRYTVMDVKIPINHTFSFKKDSTLNISFGVLAGISNISVNPNQLSYDAQWDGDAYNKGLSNGENFLRQSKLYADVGLGTVLQKRFNRKFVATLGYSIQHLNKPNISFYNTSGVVLRPKHTEQLQLKYNFSHKAAIMFEYYGGQQQAFREHLAGVSYHYTIEPLTGTILNAGMITRVGDAVITTVGIEHRNMKWQASYDYNYSPFKRATNGKGGFEISFIYIYAKLKVFVPKTRVCPVYM